MIEGRLVPVTTAVAAVAVLGTLYAWRQVRVANDVKWTRIGYWLRARWGNHWQHLSAIFRTRGCAPTPGDQSVSCSWLTAVLRHAGTLTGQWEVASATPEDLNNNQGLVSALTRLRVEYSHPDGLTEQSFPRSFVLKGSPSRFSTIATGHAREALVYSTFGPELGTGIPKIYYATGNATLGTYTILMEDLASSSGCVLRALLASPVFGIASPKDPPMSPEEAVRAMYLYAADVHARHWNDRSLLAHSWLKAADWRRGEGRARWEMSVETARMAWNNFKNTKLASGTAGWAFSPKLRAIFDRTFAASTWEALQAQLQDPRIPYCLAHGDFHPANLWFRDGEVVAFDWSEASIWEPTVDLGQALLSDVPAAMWRGSKYDVTCLRTYWTKLVELGVDANEFPFDFCYELYCRGPVAKWIWMYSMLLIYPLPPSWLEFWHDQILAFVESHGDYDTYTLGPVVTIAPN